MSSRRRKKQPMQGQIKTLRGSVETNRIITNLVTHAIVEPSEIASDILDEQLISVVKNTKDSMEAMFEAKILNSFYCRGSKCFC